LEIRPTTQVKGVIVEVIDKDNEIRDQGILEHQRLKECTIVQDT